MAAYARSPLIRGESDIGAAFVPVHDNGLHAAIPISIVDQICEQRVRHVSSHDIR